MTPGGRHFRSAQSEELALRALASRVVPHLDALAVFEGTSPTAADASAAYTLALRGCEAHLVTLRLAWRNIASVTPGASPSTDAVYAENTALRTNIHFALEHMAMRVEAWRKRAGPATPPTPEECSKCVPPTALQRHSLRFEFFLLRRALQLATPLRRPTPARPTPGPEFGAFACVTPAATSARRRAAAAPVPFLSPVAPMGALTPVNEATSPQPAPTPAQASPGEAWSPEPLSSVRVDRAAEDCVPFQLPPFELAVEAVESGAGEEGRGGGLARFVRRALLAAVLAAAAVAAQQAAKAKAARREAK